MTLIPINPLRTDDGNLVSLTALRGNLKAQPVPLDAGTTVQNVAVLLAGQQISARSLQASSKHRRSDSGLTPSHSLTLPQNKLPIT
jgi:hypothetical protein